MSKLPSPGERQMSRDSRKMILGLPKFENTFKLFAPKIRYSHTNIFQGDILKELFYIKESDCCCCCSHIYTQTHFSEILSGSIFLHTNIFQRTTLKEHFPTKESDRENTDVFVVGAHTFTHKHISANYSQRVFLCQGE